MDMPTIEDAQAINDRLAYKDIRITTFDAARYKAISNRIADELARGATELGIALDNEMDEHLLTAWMKNPEKFLYCPNRYCNEPSEGEKIEAKLSVWLDDEEAKRAAKPFVPGYVDITVSRNVIEGLELIRAATELGEISAAPGTGKTEGITEYVRRCRKTEGFSCPVGVITLHESNVSLKIIYQEILDQMKTCEQWERTTVSGDSSEKEYALLREIKSRAVRQWRGGLLVVDEAQHIGKFNGNVRPNALNILNGLRHLTDEGLFGIAMLCNGEVFEQASTGKKRSVQLSSRMKAWRIDAKKNTADDIDRIMAAWKVSGKEGRAMSHKIAGGEGGMRALTNTYKRALVKFGAINAKTISFYM